MDFFEHQEKARKKTHVLVFYFILAVLGIAVALYGVVIGISLFLGGEEQPVTLDYWQPDLFIGSLLGTSAIVSLASGYKTISLSAGGKVVAQQLGGRLLDPNTTDFHEQRLVNIVEEMAIASGIPVPQVYVMDNEDSINAFAAGKTISDAVIGVTRGCMKQLDRDELQGVVAHEFAHILNGDMRLNMRLIGLLFGILFIALIGQTILRGTYYSNLGSRRSSENSGGGILVILAAGLAVTAIGYIGLFFGKLIKAAVSRQREFLADASAVQFTRNPHGIAGALMKISALSEHSLIRHPMGEEMSHLFFGSSTRSNLFATHPPLQQRIKRLLPNWNGKIPELNPPSFSEEPETPPQPRQTSRRHPVPIPIPGVSMAHDGMSIQMTQEEMIDSMSHVHPEQLDFSHNFYEKMPIEWREAVHREDGAQALIFGLLLAQDDQLRAQEIAKLSRHTDKRTSELAVAFSEALKEAHSSVKLALVDLSLTTLRRLSHAEYHRFREIQNHLIESDGKVDLFEFTLQKMVQRHLDHYFGQRRPPKIRYRKMSQLKEECSVLLTTVAVLGSNNDLETAKRAFGRGSDEIWNHSSVTISFLPAEKCGLKDIERAMEKFSDATPLLARELLHAMGHVVMQDQKVTSNEAEIIRAVADAIGSPIPPFVKTGMETAFAS